MNVLPNLTADDAKAVADFIHPADQDGVAMLEHDIAQRVANFLRCWAQLRQAHDAAPAQRPGDCLPGGMNGA